MCKKYSKNNFRLGRCELYLQLPQWQTSYMTSLSFRCLILILFSVKDQPWEIEVISIAVQFFRFYTCFSASALHVSHAAGQWVVAPRAEVFLFRFHVCPEESWDSAQKFQAHRLIPLQSLLWLCSHKERGTQPPSAYSLKLYWVWSQSARERDHSFVL